MKTKYYFTQTIYIGSESVEVEKMDLDIKDIVFGDVVELSLQVDGCELKSSNVEFVEIKLYERHYLSDDEIIGNEFVYKDNLVFDEYGNITINYKIYIE